MVGQWTTRHSKSGWRTGVQWAMRAAAFVLVINIIFTIVSVATSKTSHGVTTIFQGRCGRVATLDSGFHIFINILSTTLLGASNYTMQCLGSPTRTDVDRAHERGGWLHIGIQSMRNLLSISRRERILWIMLCVSAFPLHLFWNSAVFSTLEANEFMVLVVTADFWTTDTFECDYHNFSITAGPYPYHYSDAVACEAATIVREASINGALQRLDNEEVMRDYRATFLTNRRNLVIVLKDIPDFYMNGSIVSYMDSSTWLMDLTSSGGSDWDPSFWICNANNEWRDTHGNCQIDVALKDAENWILGYYLPSHWDYWNLTSLLAPGEPYSIDYCLSQEVPELCRLEVGVYVMFIVIACNTVMLVCMAYATRTLRPEELPLTVIGDAVASFLDREDECTVDQCLLSAEAFTRYKSLQNADSINIWRPKRQFWLTAPGWGSWGRCIFL